MGSFHRCWYLLEKLFRPNPTECFTICSDFKQDLNICMFYILYYKCSLYAYCKMMIPNSYVKVTSIFSTNSKINEIYSPLTTNANEYL